MLTLTSSDKRLIVRSRRNIFAAIDYASFVIRKPETGYILPLNSLRHFLHLRLFPRTIHEQKYPQDGQESLAIWWQTYQFLWKSVYLRSTKSRI